MSPVFSTVPRIHFGWGLAAELGPLVTEWGRRALLVTGRQALRQAGITERLVAGLRAAGVEVALFEEVEPEPDVTTCDRGRRLCREEAVEVVVGVGGGSVLDVAKVIAGLAKELWPTREYHSGLRQVPPALGAPKGGRASTEAGLPLITVPTTSGTGAEVTPNAVITDRETRTKKSIRHDSFLARVAVVDPELTVPLPPSVTAHSGLDAFVQAVESYSSKYAWPLTEGLSLRSAGLIATCLRQAYHEGRDRDARTAMSAGSLLAGIALANARLGIVHGLAHPLGVRLGLPHGLLCGVLLPFAIELNREAAREKYEVLARVTGMDVAEFTRSLLREFGIPMDLRGAGLHRSDFADIVAEAMDSGSTKANPKQVSEADIIHILEALTG
jgi:alcohol dehydrogenase class IV